MNLEASHLKEHNIDVHVGSRIRQLRLERGRSLQSLAAQVNLPSEELETYESARAPIQASKLKELGAALGVPLSYFFEGLPERLDEVTDKAQWRSEVLLGPLLLSVAYYLGAQAAFLLGTLSDRIFAPFWPPNIILFCALLFVPYKRWWLYGVAAVPAHVLAELQVGMPILQMAVAFATNCLVALLSALGVRRLLGAPPWFDNFRRAVVYVVITAVISPAVVALGGAFVRISEGAALELYGLFWAQWYLANALASLTLGPAILTWFERDADAPASASSWRQGEGLLVAACLTLACFFVGYATPLAEGRGLLPALLYLPLPVILWATVRFGAKGASGAVLIVTVLTIWPALNGAGMFVAADPEKNVLDLQLFLVAISVPVLLLGASVDGARRSERVIRELARSLLASRDDERRTIGRDLHESIAQTLVAASWKATEAQRVAPEVRGALKDLDDLLQESICKVRTVSYLLHPPLLDEAGLETALDHYADEYSRQHSMRIELDVSPELGRMAPHIEIALFRLVEQALDVVRRKAHHDGSRIKIVPVSTLGSRDVLLTIEGVAKHTALAPDNGASLIDKVISFGRVQSDDIAGLRERVCRIGGRLEFDSSVGRTAVRILVPTG